MELPAVDLDADHTVHDEVDCSQVADRLLRLDVVPAESKPRPHDALGKAVAFAIDPLVDPLASPRQPHQELFELEEIEAAGLPAPIE